MGPPIDPLPYQRELADLVEATEPELWRWVASAATTDEFLEDIRQDLLRSTYRLERDAHPEVYGPGDEAARRLGLEVPLTIYQSQEGLGRNASLVFTPGEAVVVIYGEILNLLDATELTALLGHELSHHLLWTCEGGRYLTAGRLLNAMAAERQASDAHMESAQRFGLAVELYADRGAYVAGGENLHGAVAALVKTTTGMKTVDPAAYLRQADEVMRNFKESDATSTHPETYLRARALALWATKGIEANGEIQTLMTGPIDVDRLDLLDQRSLSDHTRSLIFQFLEDDNLWSETTLAHARSFFPDFAFSSETGPLDETSHFDAELSTSTRRYLAFVLLDFAVVDRDLDRAATVQALKVADRSGVLDQLTRLMKEELKLGRQLKSLLADADITAEADK